MRSPVLRQKLVSSCRVFFVLDEKRSCLVFPSFAGEVRVSFSLWRIYFRVQSLFCTVLLTRPRPNDPVPAGLLLIPCHPLLRERTSLLYVSSLSFTTFFGAGRYGPWSVMTLPLIFYPFPTVQTSCPAFTGFPERWVLLAVQSVDVGSRVYRPVMVTSNFVCWSLLQPHHQGIK